MWLLMPSVLLVRQIPYRALFPGAESRDPPLESSCLFAVALRCLGFTTRSWSVLVLDSIGGVSWT